MRIHAKLGQESATRARLALLTLSAAVAISVPSHAQKIITFDAPNAGTAFNYGTYPVDINIWGAVTGSVIDNGNGQHGFVRDPFGKISDFDVPAANPVIGCTCPNAINDFGVIAGVYVDNNQINHGFLRTPDGKFTSFDDPEAGTSAYQGTLPLAINNLGAVVGWYFDANWVTHGFLRAPDGKFTTIDDPVGGTTAASINDFGVIVGTVQDSNNVGHGFVRTPGGEITTFDAPAALGGAIGTISALINDAGIITGAYNDATSNVYVGYTRSPEGKFTTFSAPNAGPYAYTGTYDVSRATVFGGATTGGVIDENYIAYPFLREGDSKATTFQIPGQWLTPYYDLGASGQAINEEQVVVGTWHDSNGMVHGFLRFPK